MYAHSPPADHRTYRHASTLETTVVLAAVPPVALLAASFPVAAGALAVGLVAGGAVGRATGR
ncbi:hypothetical protein [Halorarum salinum]|uniref:Uncharacterized protein n=1 Tax=Halorarum salinum TaxID=2743089 RepID=A0A7D5LAE0_9EURY|nr:hypothetical protein [Halobaculum salinum]QLG61828.1 hypothetical protein HUG12_08860 [Halobaculum salinum]